MRIQSCLLATFTVVIFLSGCSRSTVSLEFTNARDEVPALGNLSFRFDKPLIKDSMVDRWDSTEYISFEPKILRALPLGKPERAGLLPIGAIVPRHYFPGNPKERAACQ